MGNAITRQLKCALAAIGIAALLIACVSWKSSVDNKRELAAWGRIQALGGNGVWESDMVVVVLEGTSITDADLALFHDFPRVQSLDLSNTEITDGGLTYLSNLPSLETLIVINTKISPAGLDEFRRSHPSVNVTTAHPPKGTINPFTGQPLSESK
ncbi:MAG: hypothetical protein ACJ8C4_14660 [Gemmataceae bacterium]